MTQRGGATAARLRSREADVISHNVNIPTCERDGQRERAQRHLYIEEMRRRSQKPEVISCDAPRSACKKSGQQEQALGLVG